MPGRRTLANLAIGSAALPSGTFPPGLTALALPNCQLADYPLDLPLLEQLEDLYAFPQPSRRTLCMPPRG